MLPANLYEGVVDEFSKNFKKREHLYHKIL
jgi:hypothetical protein